MKKRSNNKKGTIAMKVDMSKVYDRVEWDFLKKILLAIGFDGRWVNIVMTCVSNITYSFIINENVYGEISPSQRLRQRPSVPLPIYLTD